jgi:cysteine-rich repeat protein
VALSATRLAALVSEAGEGANLNGDADAEPDDLVLHVRAASGAGAGATCAASGWDPTGQAADALAVVGDLVAITVPEAAQGAGPLNGDGDTGDRVLRLVDGTDGSLLPLFDPSGSPDVLQAAEEFVLGEALVAFRTSEAAQSNAAPPACSLNGDADCDDDVLQVYELATGRRRSSGQAVLPCPLAECDPRQPYRVSQETVRFLTLESDQDEDLNDDGDQLDLLVQLFNVASGQTEVIAEVAQTASQTPGTASDPLAAPSDATTGAASDQAVVAQGRCVEDTAVACTTPPDSCASGQFCFADSATCVVDTGRTCYLDRPAAEQGCLTGSVCVADFTVLAIADRDADQVPDGLDNCPTSANTDQADADGDGVGDACDLQTCGDGAPQLDEQCDDGNLVDGDGCDANCTDTACGNGVQTAGEACDDGNLLNGDGCSSTCTNGTAGQVAPLAGKLLLVKDKDGDATKRKVVFLSKDPGVVTPVGGAGDPTQAGGELVLRNPTTSEEIAVALPGSHWEGLGNPAGSKGWIYKDLGLADGPCKVVVAKPGKLLRAVCLGSQIGFTLDEPSGQGSLLATLQVGADPPQCVAFTPPGVLKDLPAQSGGTGIFKGLDAPAPAPASCPAP